MVLHILTPNSLLVRIAVGSTRRGVEGGGPTTILVLIPDVFHYLYIFPQHMSAGMEQSFKKEYMKSLDFPRLGQSSVHQRDDLLRLPHFQSIFPVFRDPDKSLSSSTDISSSVHIGPR